MSNRNDLLVKIVEKVGGTVTNPNVQNSLLEDWLSAIGGAPVIEKYDTIVGVGASITNGVFQLTDQFKIPFRGTKFKSVAVPGASLADIIAQIDDIKALAEGVTLYAMHAGGNNCTFLLADGGPGGTVGAWGPDTTQGEKDSVEAEYRQLVSLLEPTGDVAIGSLTFRDYQDSVANAPDPDAISSGSMNDGLIVPLCQELTPKFFIGGRPVLDFYSFGRADPSILDADNVHMYTDYLYDPVNVNVARGPGTSTMRLYLIKQLESIGAIYPTPFDNSIYKNRIAINVGAADALDAKPSLQTWGNNLTVTPSMDSTFSLLSHANPTSPGAQSVRIVSGPLFARTNLDTSAIEWDEGIQDPNLLSNSVGSNNLISFTLSDVARSGRVYVAGLHTVGSINTGRRAEITVIDKNGSHVSEIENTSIDITVADYVTSQDYELNAGQDLIIEVRNAPGAAYGYVGGVVIDEHK